MRAIVVLVASMMLGLAGGYTWSAMTRPKAHVRVPKVPKTKSIVIPETALDEQWSRRAEEPEDAPFPHASEQSVYYSGCNAVRAAGKAPLLEGQPGYRAELDGDDDGIACEPRPGA